MKLEFLPHGSGDCPLIRLYDFDVIGACRLREALRALSDGSRQHIPLHEEWWIEPLDNCCLDLRIGERDLGVVQRLPLRFECILTQEGWWETMELADSLCTEPIEATAFTYQWLNEDGEVSLLFSSTGRW
jgi:hypothetical protein